MSGIDYERNYYEDLELKPDAEPKDIQYQHRKLALKWHPDKNRGDEAECRTKFQVIQKAYEILKDPTERAKYDQHRNSQAGEASRNADKGSNQPPPRGPPTASQDGQKGRQRPGFSFMKPRNPQRSPYPGHQPGGWPTAPDTQTSHPRWRPPPGPGNFGRGFGVGGFYPHGQNVRTYSEKRNRHEGWKREGERPIGRGSSVNRNLSPIRTGKSGRFDGSNPTQDTPTGFDPNGSSADERMAPQGVSGYRDSEPTTLGADRETTPQDASPFKRDTLGASGRAFVAGFSPNKENPSPTPSRRKRKLICTAPAKTPWRHTLRVVRVEIASDEDEPIDYPQTVTDLKTRVIAVPKSQIKICQTRSDPHKN